MGRVLLQLTSFRAAGDSIQRYLRTSFAQPWGDILLWPPCSGASKTLLMHDHHEVTNDPERSRRDGEIGKIEDHPVAQADVIGDRAAPRTFAGMAERSAEQQAEAD